MGWLLMRAVLLIMDNLVTPIHQIAYRCEPACQP